MRLLAGLGAFDLVFIDRGCRRIAAFATIEKMEMRIVGDGGHDTGHDGGALTVGAKMNVAALFSSLQIGVNFIGQCFAAIDRHPKSIAKFAKIGVVAGIIAVAFRIKITKFPAGLHQDQGNQRNIKCFEPSLDISAFFMGRGNCFEAQAGRWKGKIGAIFWNRAAVTWATIKYFKQPGGHSFELGQVILWLDNN